MYKLTLPRPLVVTFKHEIDDSYEEKMRDRFYRLFTISFIERIAPCKFVALVPEGKYDELKSFFTHLVGVGAIDDSQVLYLMEST